MNFLDGIVKEDSGKIVVDFGIFKIKVPDGKFKHIRQYINKPIIFGIRPQSILDREMVPDATEDQVITGIVDVSELIGSEVNLFLSVGEYSFTANVESHTKAKDGEKHQVVFDCNKIHLFDKDTEKAIV